MVRKRYYKIIFILAILFTGNCWAGYAQQIADDGPVAWWRFNDYRYKEGLPAVEETGNITSSVYQGDAMTVEAGIGGKCGWFNGNTAGVDFGNQLGSFLDGASAITFEAWVKNSFLEDGEPVQVFFVTRINGGSSGITAALGNYSGGGGYVLVGMRSVSSDSYMTVKTDYTTVNQWTHVAAVIDYPNDKLDIYLNGILAHGQTVNFGSNSYVYGTPTLIDQIGRTPNIENSYRGWLDEVAVYDKALTPSQIANHYYLGNPADEGDLWVSEISNDGGVEGLYLGNPYLHNFDNGVIVASHYYSGSNKPVVSASTIKISYDDGQTWFLQGYCQDVVGGSLFEYDGALYILGYNRPVGDIAIAKSYNYGSTWTMPNDTNTGLLFECQNPGVLGFSGISMPVLLANGRVYRVYHQMDKSLTWPYDCAAVMVSADLDADLLNADSWTISNIVHFNSSWAEPEWDRPGWLEGNAVQSYDGQILAIMRMSTDPEVGVAAILTLSADNTTLSFDPSTGFIDMPGGRNKFNIHKDPTTGKYLTLVNNNTESTIAYQRNTLSLISSNNLVDWTHVRTVLQDNSPMTWIESVEDTGFQYVAWEFDGDDIIFISRTSYDGADNYHNSNRITFHRLSNYMDFVIPCGYWGYLDSDFNRDCFVDFEDLEIFLNQWISNYDFQDYSDFAIQWRGCTQPYGQGCVNGLYQ